MDQYVHQFGSIEAAIESLRAMAGSDQVDPRLDLQTLLNALGREEEAFEVCQQLERIAPDHPRALFNRAYHALKRGYLEEGLALFEVGRQLGVYGTKPLDTGAPLWVPESGRGQRVHVNLEGGFGDEIIQVRAAIELARRFDVKVNLLCHPGLAPIFARVPEIATVAQKEAAPGIYHDSWLPGMSLYLAMGLKYEDLVGDAYLEPHPALVENWRSNLEASEGKFRIGLRWAGNPQFDHQQLRVFTPEMLFSLPRKDDIQYFSFQRDDARTKIPSHVTDLGPSLLSWDETAAALANMDLVISSCTSVAHLSAAMGIPTWIIVPALPYWIWALPGDKTPFYDSVRLFRQSRYGDWSDVAANLSRHVENEFAIRK
jgi:hypothetical protein